MKKNLTKKFILNDGNKIEYYMSNQVNDKPTLVISMGIWEPAIRALPLISRLTGIHCIALSYRGRGGSSTPKSGFDWHHHVSDIKRVLQNEPINKPVFLGFSKGVSYMLGFLSLNIELAKSIIIIDYPAIHSKLEKGAAKFWSDMVYNGIKLDNFITTHTLNGIENESTYKEFYHNLNAMDCPVWLFRGVDLDSNIPSNLTDDDIIKYKENVKQLEIINFKYSGHMILDEELGKATTYIKEILDKLN